MNAQQRPQQQPNMDIGLNRLLAQKIEVKVRYGAPESLQEVRGVLRSLSGGGFVEIVMAAGNVKIIPLNLILDIEECLIVGRASTLVMP